MTTVQKKQVKTKDEERTASTSTGSEVDSDVSSAAGSKQKLRREEGPLLLKRGAIGTVDFFSRRSNFGFIIVEENEERIFVHANSVLTFLPTIVCVLHEGDKVEFDIIKGVKGKEAVAVTGIGGFKIGSRRLMNDLRRGGTTYSRFIPARVRNGNDNGAGGPDEQAVDDMKKLSVADTKAEKDKEDTNKTTATSVGKEKKAKKQGEEKKAEEDKTERDTGAEGPKPRRKQSRKGRDKKDSATAGNKEDK